MLSPRALAEMKLTILTQHRAKFFETWLLRARKIPTCKNNTYVREGPLEPK